MGWDSTGSAIYSERVRSEEKASGIINNPNDEFGYEKQLENFENWQRQIQQSNPRGTIYARPPTAQPSTARRGWESGYRFPANNMKKTMVRVLQNSRQEDARAQQRQQAQEAWSRMSGAATARSPTYRERPQSSPGYRRNGGNYGTQTARYAPRSTGHHSAMKPFLEYPSPSTLSAYSAFAKKDKIYPHPPYHETEGGVIAQQCGYEQGIPTPNFNVKTAHQYKAYYEHLEAQDKERVAAREAALYGRPGEAELFIKNRRDTITLRGHFEH